MSKWDNNVSRGVGHFTDMGIGQDLRGTDTDG
jgi:hypothetical protein